MAEPALEDLPYHFFNEIIIASSPSLGDENDAGIRGCGGNFRSLRHRVFPAPLYSACLP
jgi:hypothetical protein